MNGVQGPPMTWREWLVLAVLVPPLALVEICAVGLLLEGYFMRLAGQ